MLLPNAHQCSSGLTDTNSDTDDYVTLFDAAPQIQPATNDKSRQQQAELEASLNAQRRLAAGLQESKQRLESEIVRLQKQLDKQTQDAKQLTDQVLTLQRTKGKDEADTAHAWHQRVSQLQLQAKTASSSAQKRIDELERDLANTRAEQRQQVQDSTLSQKETEAAMSSLQEKLTTALAQEQKRRTEQMAMNAEMREIRKRLEVEQATCKALREAAAEAQVQLKSDLCANLVHLRNNDLT